MKAPQLFDLSGRCAFVTGGSAGIGLDIAEALGEMGARLVITARKPERLRAAEERLRARGIAVHSISADVSRPEAITPLVEEACERLGGRIDILVNNAGTNWIAPAEEYPDAGWAKVMTLCIDGPFRLTREVGRRAMIPQGGGRVINIGSIAALRGNATGKPGGGHFIAYHAAKGALHSFTRGLAVEWGRRNVTVNCLCPGFIETEAAAAFQNSVQDAAVAQTPLGRFGTADDIKGVAVFLASDAAAFVTGQTIVVDGGLSAS